MGLVDVRQKDETKKWCVDCNTTNTPLWRAGPAGPKSLCNACGIRFRKRRISTNRGREKKRERAHSKVNGCSAVSGTASTCGDGEEEDSGECMSFRMRLMVPFGEEEVLMLQNLPSSVKKKLGEEEEQAAVSLMALSCSSVYA